MKACLKPRVVHGLPLTPARLMDELRGESFCVSFATCGPAVVDRAIERVDKNGILMVDNGAFSIWRSGKGKVDRNAFFAWSNRILERCEVAVACIPDVIEGSEEENWEEAARAVHELAAYPERLMFVWHMNDSLEGLKRACRLFNFVAIGSCAEYDVARNRPGYMARLKEAWAVIGAVEALHGRRPWIHLMRGLAVLPEVLAANSADSVNVARNHCRTKGAPRHVAAMANRIRGAVARAAAAAGVAEALPTSNFG